MDQIKSYHVSKENTLIQLKPSVFPVLQSCCLYQFPVSTDHNLEMNENFRHRNFFENILEVKDFSLKGFQFAVFLADVTYGERSFECLLLQGTCTGRLPRGMDGLSHAQPCECMSFRDNLEY